MNILVTGGAGAIGGNLVHRLLAETDHKLIVLDDLSSGHESNVPSNERVLFVRGSIVDDEILQEVFSSAPPQIIFHLAANFANQNSVDYPKKDLEVNGMGTLKLLEYAAAHKVSRFIYSSSSCVYGNRPGVLKEDCQEFSVDTPYAITKLLGERYVRFFHDHHKLGTVILRFFNTFGPLEYPGKYRNVIPNFILRALRGEPLPITGTGEETRDFNFVDNTVSGIFSSMTAKNIEGKIFNLASGKETSIREIAQEINRLTGNPAGIEFKERRSWDTVVRRLASVDEARKYLGYEPKVSAMAGIQKTYEWIKSQDLKGIKL